MYQMKLFQPRGRQTVPPRSPGRAPSLRAVRKEGFPPTQRWPLLVSFCFNCSQFHGTCQAMKEEGKDMGRWRIPLLMGAMWLKHHLGFSKGFQGWQVEPLLSPSEPKSSAQVGSHGTSVASRKMERMPGRKEPKGRHSDQLRQLGKKAAGIG